MKIPRFAASSTSIAHINESLDHFWQSHHIICDKGANENTQVLIAENWYVVWNLNAKYARSKEPSVGYCVFEFML